MEFRTLDIVSIAVGFLGVVLAIVSLVCHRLRSKYHRMERLSAKLGWVTGKDLPATAICLDVWNIGRLPVTLKKIQLMWREPEGEKVNSMGFAPYSRVDGALTQSASDDPLQMCEGRTFILPLPPSMLRRPAQQSDKDIWIAAQSANGEILRIPGEELRPVLQRCLEEQPARV